VSGAAALGFLEEVASTRTTRSTSRPTCNKTSSDMTSVPDVKRGLTKRLSEDDA